MLSILVSAIMVLYPFDEINRLVGESAKNPENLKLPEIIEMRRGKLQYGVGTEKSPLMGFKGDMWINDTLVIGDTTWYQDGNIIVYQNGMLEIKNSNFYIYGWIIGLDQAKILIDSSYVRFNSQYPWHFGFYLRDTAELNITGSELSYNLFPGHILARDQSKVIINTLESPDFTTAEFYGNASCEIKNVTGHTGEFCAWDSGSMEFSNVEHLHIWLAFIGSSIVDISVPPKYDTLFHWEFDSLTSGVSGIPYSIIVDTSYEVSFGVRSFPGSDVTLRDCPDSVVCILMFYEPDTTNINGLTNGCYYSDWSIPLVDRKLRLINTWIYAWSMQIHNGNINIDNSIFGELLSYDSARVYVDNCIHDGRCGPHTVSGYSFQYIENSNFNTNERIRSNGVCAFFYSIIWKTINVDGTFGKPLLVLLNTEYFDSPLMIDSATIFCASIDGPSQAGINDSVIIEGSAWIDGGPYSPYEFDAYKLNYAHYTDSLGPWQPLTDWINNEVRDSVLAIWSTYGLECGYYFLALWIKDNLGDSVATYKLVRLLEAGIEESPKFKNQSAKLEIHPNPFASVTTIRYSVAEQGHVELKIYNVAGRLVKTLVNGQQKAGSYTIEWDSKDTNGKLLPSGIYFVELKVDDKFTQAKKLLLLR